MEPVWIPGSVLAHTCRGARSVISRNQEHSSYVREEFGVRPSRWDSYILLAYLALSL